ncbi:MAG: hypothetical protein RIT01_177, partial [Pseudomonadota bacterium]
GKVLAFKGAPRLGSVSPLNLAPAALMITRSSFVLSTLIPSPPTRSFARTASPISLTTKI